MNIFLATIATIILATSGLYASNPITAPSAGVSVSDNPSRVYLEDATWSAARDLQARGDYSAAVREFEALIERYPDVQRLKVRLARNEELLGNHEHALRSYEAAVSSDPRGEWTPFAVYRQSVVLRSVGDSQSLRDNVDRLMRFHPDSPYNARMELLLAENEGHDIESAESRLELELTAGQVVDRAYSLVDADAEEADRLYRHVIREFPQAYVTWRAHEGLGHLALLQGRDEEALVVFTEIVLALGERHPESRIVLEASSRLAALYHRSAQREKAIELFLDIIKNSSTGNRYSANASVQIVGLYFEILQRQAEVQEAEWEQLREMCYSALDLRVLTEEERHRTRLMYLESYYWQGDYTRARDLAKEFLLQCERSDFSKEYDTAVYFLGRSHYDLEEYEDSLAQFSLLSALYEGNDEIWPGMSHVRTSLYMVVLCLQKMDAPNDRIGPAIGELFERFPDSDHARLVGLNFPWAIKQ